MHIERLTRLSALMREIAGDPSRRLWLSSWASQRDQENISECGTTACACGWAGVTPWFVEQGFTMSHTDNGGKPVIITTLKDMAAAIGAGEMLEPRYEGLTHFMAVTAFFELPLQAANWLFNDYAYKDETETADEITPLHVARRIDQLLVLGETHPIMQHPPGT